MTGSERRQELLQLLSGTQTPISGASLAKHFTVSRQVIVQDMALLRAKGHEVLSTNRGYLIQAPLRVSRIFKVFHTSEQIVDELCTIVDLGGTVEDVFVHHKIYGQLQAPLHISSRRDVQLFLEELKSGKSTPLKDVTSGYHYHTVSADSGETLDLIGQELGKKGYLCQ